MTQRREYRKGKDYTGRDFYHTYRDFGGTRFNRNNFTEACNDVFQAISKVSVEEDIDFKFPYIHWIFGMRERTWMGVDFDKSLLAAKAMHPDKDARDALYMKGVAVIPKKITHPVMQWFKHYPAKCSSIYRLKIRLYRFKPTAKTRIIIKDQVNNGKFYFR